MQYDSQNNTPLVFVIVIGNDTVSHSLTESWLITSQIVTRTRCMAMSNLMVASWVGQNAGPIFWRLWTKVHQVKFACKRVSVVCNAVFQLTMSCCFRQIFAIKLRNCAKSCQNFYVSGPPNFGGRGHPNLRPGFINLGHHWTCGKVWWQSTEQPRRLGGKKRSKLQW